MSQWVVNPTYGGGEGEILQREGRERGFANQASKAERPGFKSHLCHPAAVCLWASVFTPLIFDFLTYKRGANSSLSPSGWL